MTSAILFYLVSFFGITPKTNLVIFGGTFTVLFITWRRTFYSFFAKYFKKNIVFITGSHTPSLYINELINYIENYPQSGFNILGSYPSFEEFPQMSTQKVETLIISNDIQLEGNLKNIYSSANQIIHFAYAYEDILGKIPVGFLNTAWFLHNIQKDQKILYRHFARAVNILVSLTVLIALSPVLIFIAILIKLSDKGPVFYTQNRIGKHGVQFKLYKFRSMIADADKNGAEWTEKNDLRITSLGKILRKLHVDEIPQLFNVLRGEMELVGPRPEIPSFAEKLEREIPHYSLRNVIKPGLTGWAQIKFKNARGIVESTTKFEYDLYYIKNQNIFLDAGIIVRTIIILFTHD